ncbi:MAG: glycosyltransferase family 2 protein [Candidatus Sericytochromatia bacterium]
MPSLSAVVITHNEASRVAGCLESLAFADEIVVVDDASTDATASVARRYTPRVIVHAHEGENFDLNKNVGMDAATGEWVLLVDADERVTEALASEIRRVIAANPPEAAFWLPRREFYFGRHARHAASSAQVLRLFRRGKARFSGERLHAHPEVSGAIGTLAAPLDHHAYDTLGAYWQKTHAYTDHEARTRFTAGERARLADVALEPAKLFRYRYWKLKGYKDGMHGLVFCLATSLYPLMQNWKLYRLGRGARSTPE